MNDHTNGTNGNGAYSANGHTNGNGNGHNKGIFDLAPKQDPLLSTIVPAARRRVCLMTRICEAARMFYCYLTDCSLLPGVNSRKGVVKFSDHDLAIRFKVDPKTIRNWKRALEATGEVWLTEKWMKNSFPQTVYNIAAIVGQATLPLNSDSDDGSLAEDEVFSSNRRRQQSSKRAGGKFACRLHGVSNCDLCRRRTPPGVPALVTPTATPQNTEENDTAGKILPPTTAIDCRPPRQMVAAHHGNRLPTPSATDCRPARQTVAGVGGKRLPLSPANGFRGARQTVAGNGKTEDRESVLKEIRGEPLPPDLDVEAALKDGDGAFADWRESWTGAYRGKMEKELGRIRVKLQTGPSAFWKRRADFLQTKLDGGKPPAPKPGPARSVKPATAKPVIPFEDRKKLFQKAKAEAGL